MLPTATSLRHFAVALRLSGAVLVLGCSYKSVVTPDMATGKPDSTRTVDAGTDSASQDVPGDSVLPAPDLVADADGALHETKGDEEVLAPDGGNDVDVGGPVTPTWGWISVIEWNDVCDQWYLKTEWNGGVRAYFATESSFPRALPHHLGNMKAVATVGDCTLFDPQVMGKNCPIEMSCPCLDKGVECYNEDETERWCEEDEICVVDDIEPWEFTHGHCEPLPEHFSAGTVTIEGLKLPISMEPDEMDRYIAAKLPNPDDLFDKGDAITATTSGGDLNPMTFQAAGVAPLDVVDSVAEISSGSGPAVISWVPADPESRVQVYLAVGSHDPNPLAAAILCDVPDSQGQVEVDQGLLAQLQELACKGQWMQKCSRITRYSRHVKTIGGKEVELFVGSAHNIQMLPE